MMAGKPLPEAPRGAASSLPRGIWALGLCSMFMDVSSELVHSLLPVLLSTVLGASMLTIGLLEGVAEATAAITKVFSGSLSDWLGRRKPLAVIGYGLAALTKPVFPLAGSVAWVFFARFVDRIGKGIRGAPRDALIADLVAEDKRGAAYGLRQSLDSVGAFLGPLLAIVAMGWLAGDVRAVMWVAVLPAMIAVLVLVVGVREPPPDPAATAAKRPDLLLGWRALPARYWRVCAFGTVFTLARFSEAFLILKAQQTGLALQWLPLVLIVMNLVYALSAYPVGWLSDRLAPRRLLLAGTMVLLLADGVLAFAATPAAALAGAALWGLHMGLTQGLLAKLVADAAPARLRGTAFGVFNLLLGLALFAASAIAGGLWAWFGPVATFLSGGVLAATVVLALLLVPTSAARQ